jgi:hypothetical protein
MRTAVFTFLALLTPLVGAGARADPMIGSIQDPAFADGCGCTFHRPGDAARKVWTRPVFLSTEGSPPGQNKAVMNLRGRDVEVTPSTMRWFRDVPNPARGDRMSDTFRTADGRMTIRLDRTLRDLCPQGVRECESFAYDATFHVFGPSGQRLQTLRAKGECGC